MTNTVEAIEHDLELVVRNYQGFERPATLVPLLSVLSLPCVYAAAGDQASHPQARVLALKTVLSQVISALTDIRARASAEILFFIADGYQDAGLQVRRAAIADIYKRGRDSVRKGIEQRLIALVAGELVRHDLLAHPDQYGTATNSLGLENASSDDPSPQLSRLARDLIGSDPTPLLRLILPGGIRLAGTSLGLQLSDSPVDEDRYLYVSQLHVQARIDEYVMAMVPSPRHSEVIFARAEGVTDVFSGHAVDSPPVRVLQKGYDSGGRPTRVQKALLELDEQDSAKYLRDVPAETAATVRLFRAPLQRSRDPARLLVIHELVLEKNDHYCYWVADRPLQLENISIDVSQLTPMTEDRAGAITLVPFMGNLTQRLELEDGRCEIPGPTWLVRGQGFALIW